MRTLTMTIPLLPGIVAEVTIKSETREITPDHMALVARHLDFNVKNWTTEIIKAEREKEKTRRTFTTNERTDDHETNPD